jgi:creatinine amidohydrolase
MDFPGTINCDWRHFIDHVLDVTKSLAYHGFKKLLLLNGHGSNMPLLDLVARRINLETDAECVAMAWWSLLTIDKEFLPSWRESYFPGGCAHACELETSLYLYASGDDVRKDKIEAGTMAMNADANPFIWADLFAAGPGLFVPWTSSYAPNGVMGEAQLASAEKGKRAYEEAVKQLIRFVEYFRDRPVDQRADHHRHAPTMPMPWGQRPVVPR